MAKLCGAIGTTAGPRNLIAAIAFAVTVGSAGTSPVLAAWPSVDWPDLESRSYMSTWQDLERSCWTVQAFDDDPTPLELKRALAQVGSHGRTRLDLGLSRFAREVPNRAEDPYGRPLKLPLPSWRNPLAAARAIAAAKTMAGVKELVLDGYPLSAEAAGILAASANLGALEGLSLSRARVSGPALHALLAPGALPALVDLDLTNNPLKAGDLEELAARLVARKVRRLELGARKEDSPDLTMKRLPHDPAALAALVKIAGVPSLTRLGLNNQRVGFAELEALLKVHREQPIEIEVATLPTLTDGQLAALAALDPDLRMTLAIIDLGIEPARLGALDRSGLLAKVTSLGLRCGDACAQILARSSHTKHLRRLVFGCEENVDITSKTGVALASAADLRGLRELSFMNSIEGCKQSGIEAEGLRRLLKSPLAGQLESLDFENQSLGGPGYLALAGATSLTALKRLAASDEGTILTADNVGLFFRDGELASHLEVLRLKNESAEGGPLDELAKGVRMPKLRVLELPVVDGPQSAWLKLARAPGWQDVRVLRIPTLDGAQSASKILKEFRFHLAPDACVP